MRSFQVSAREASLLASSNDDDTLVPSTAAVVTRMIGSEVMSVIASLQTKKLVEAVDDGFHLTADGADVKRILTGKWSDAINNSSGPIELSLVPEGVAEPMAQPSLEELKSTVHELLSADQ